MTKTIKRFLMVFAVLFVMFGLVACESEEEKQLKADLEKLETSKTELTINAEANANFTLPTVEGVTITWTSGTTSVIKIEGNNAVVTVPAFGQPDATVKITATLKIGEQSVVKEFTVKVKASTVDPQIAKDAYLKDNVLPEVKLPTSINPENVVLNFTLPDEVAGFEGSTIEWSSTCSAITVIANSATVKAPAYEDGDAEGKLVATVTYDGATGTKEFDVTVLKTHMADVVKAYDKLALTNTDSVTADINLPTRVLDDSGSAIPGIKIVWTSSDNDVISIEDKDADNKNAKVTRPGKGEADANVTLTATITKTLSGQTDTMIKEFAVKVVAIPLPTAVETINDVFTLPVNTEVEFSGTVIYILNKGNGSQDIEGIVVADANGAVYCYGAPNENVKVGDKVTLVGTFVMYYYQPEVKEYAITEFEASDAGYDFSNAPAKTVEEIMAIPYNSDDDKTVRQNFSDVYNIYGQIIEENGNYYLQSVAGTRVTLYYKATVVASGENFVANYEAYKDKWVNATALLYDFHSTSLVWRVVTVPGLITEAEAPELTDAQKVSFAKGLLAKELTEKMEVIAKVSLPTSYDQYEGLAITWASANEAVLAADGTVKDFSADTEVKLTATLTCGTETDTFEVTVTVKAMEVSTVADVIAAIDAKSDEVFLLEVVVLQNLNSKYNNLFVGDVTGVLYVYGASCEGTLAAGDKIQLITGDLAIYEGSASYPESTRQTKNATAFKLAADADVAGPDSVATTPSALSIASAEEFAALIDGSQLLCVTGTVSVGADDYNIRITETVEGVEKAIYVNKSSGNLAALKAYDGQKVNFTCVAYGAYKAGDNWYVRVYGLNRDGDIQKWIQQPTETVKIGIWNKNIWAADYKNNALFYDKGFSESKTSVWADRVGISWDETLNEYVVKELLASGVAGTTTITTWDYLLTITEEGDVALVSETIKVGDIMRIDVGDAKQALAWLNGKNGATLNWNLLFYPAGTVLDAAAAPVLPQGIPYEVASLPVTPEAGWAYSATFGTYSDGSLKCNTSGMTITTPELYNNEKLSVSMKVKANGSNGVFDGKLVFTALDGSKNPIEGGVQEWTTTTEGEQTATATLAVEGIKYVKVEFVKTTGNFGLYDFKLAVYKTQAELDTEAVAAAKKAISVEKQATADFTLPVTHEETGVAISWASDNAAIAIEGGNAVVTLGNEEVTVTLTATFTKGDATSTATYAVIVPQSDGLVINEALINSILEEGQTVKYYKYATANVVDGSCTFATQQSYAGFGGMVMIIGTNVYFLGKGALIELDSAVLGKTELTKTELRPYGFYGTTETNNQGLTFENGVVEAGNGRGYGALYYNSGAAAVTFTVQDGYGRDYNGVGAHRLVLTLNPETGLYTPREVLCADVITLNPGEYMFAPSTLERYSTGLVTSSYTAAADGTAAVAGALVAGSNNVQITTIEALYAAKFGKATSVINTNGGTANRTVDSYKQEFLTDFYNWCVAKGAFTAEEVSLETFIGTTGADKKTTGTWCNYTGGAGNPSSVFTNFDSANMVNFMIAPTPDETDAASLRTNEVLADTTYFLNDSVYNAKWAPLMAHIESLFGAARAWSAPTNYYIYELGRWMQAENKDVTYVTDELMNDIPAVWKTELPGSVELTADETYTLPTVMYNGNLVFGGWINDAGEAITVLHFGENANAVWLEDGKVVLFSDIIVNAAWADKAAEEVVTVNGKDYTIGTTAFATLDAAIAAAANGQEIGVVAGSYTLGVAINKSLVIRGEDAATTIVTVAATGTTANIAAETIVLDNLTLQGVGKNSAGIYFVPSAAAHYFTIQNCVIDGMNTVYKGIVDVTKPVVLTIKDSEIKGVGQFLIWVTKGIEKINFTGNTVDCANCGSIDNTAAALIRARVGEVYVAYNTFTGTTPSIDGLFEASVDCTGITVEYNTFNNVGKFVHMNTGSEKPVTFGVNLYLDAEGAVLTEVPAAITGTGVTAGTAAASAEDLVPAAE